MGPWASGRCETRRERRAGHCPHSADLRHVSRTPQDPSQQRPAGARGAQGASPGRARLPVTWGQGRAAPKGGPSPPSPAALARPPTRAYAARGAGGGGEPARGGGQGRAGEGRGGRRRSVGQPDSGRDKGVRRRGLPACPPGRRDAARPPFPPAAITRPGSPLPGEPLAAPPGRAPLTCGRRARLGPRSRLKSAPSPPPNPATAGSATASSPRRLGQDTLGRRRSSAPRNGRSGYSLAAAAAAAAVVAAVSRVLEPAARPR